MLTASAPISISISTSRILFSDRIKLLSELLVRKALANRATPSMGCVARNFGTEIMVGRGSGVETASLGTEAGFESLHYLNKMV